MVNDKDWIINASQKKFSLEKLESTAACLCETVRDRAKLCLYNSKTLDIS
jgi:hypothetical protein